MNTEFFGTCDYSALEKSYKEALKDKDFEYLVSKIDLEESKIMKHTSKIKFSSDELKNCKNCKGLHECKNKINGFVYYPVSKNGRLCFEYKACKYKKKTLEEMENSCNYYEMPDALKVARMKDIDLNDAKRVNAIKWLKNFYDTYRSNPKQKGLYLHGSFGSGKTFLICAMLNELAKYNHDITIVYYPELLRSLKEAFETDFANRIDKIKRASILFLDDIGAEAVTPWARDEILGTILQYRMDSSLPTFFSSNLTIEELEVHLSNTKNGVDKVKARRIIERIKYLTNDIELVSINRRN